VFTVAGSGTDIWGTGDQFHFAYQVVKGDMTLTARVVSQSNTDPWAKAGVMIRDTLTAGSKQVFVMATPTSSHGIAMQYRSSDAGSSAMSDSINGPVVPYWVRLVRSNDTFSGYCSPDGQAWTQVGTNVTISMSQALVAGLAVCSHTTNASSTAVFDNVSLIQPGFSIEVSPVSQTVTGGQSASYTVTVSPTNGFTGPVALSVAGLPAGVSASFNPTAIDTSGTSTLTLVTSNSTPGDIYDLFVTGTNGPIVSVNGQEVTLEVIATDSDGDGIPDWWMLQYFGHATGSAGDNSRATDDADNDGLSNMDEYLAGTNPTVHNPANLTWASVSSSAWDVTNSVNWNIPGSSRLFYNGDNVLFDDTAGVVTNVTIASGISVQPGIVTNNSSTKSFTISGSGKISGPALLVKSGNSKLTISTANDFTGNIFVQGGTLSISAENNLGANPNTLTTNQLTLDGGTLQTAVTFSIDDGNRGITLGGNGGTINVTANTLTVVDLINGGGTLTKTGDGTLALNSVNTWSGGSIATAGAFRANIVGAYGSGLVTVNGLGTAYHNAGGTYTNAYDLNGIGPVEATGNFGAIRFANNSSTATILTGPIHLSGDSRISARGIAYSNPGGMISGRITGDKALEFGNSGDTSNPGRITLSNSGNNWSGNTTISHGTLRVGVAEVIPNGAGNGNVIINNSNPTNDSILDLNGFNETINGLAATGNGLARCVVSNSSAIAATLTLGDGDANAAFGGVIKAATGVIALTKIGAGAETLGGANTYTGATTISNGTLVVNGSVGNTVVTVRSNGTLSGNGVINGTVTVNSGATLSPGNSIGALTINGTVTLQGTTFMELNKSLGTNDVIRGATAIQYGGTLSLTNLSGTLVTNDSFKLFYANTYSGAFARIVPAIPGLGLAWNTNTLTDGTLGIVAAATSSPGINAVEMSGGALVFRGTNGVPGWTYYVLTSTNLTVPLTNWDVIATRAFDTSGNFSVTQNLDAAVVNRFYKIRLSP